MGKAGIRDLHRMQAINKAGTSHHRNKAGILHQETTRRRANTTRVRLRQTNSGVKDHHHRATSSKARPLLRSMARQLNRLLDTGKCQTSRSSRILDAMPQIYGTP